MTEEDPIPIPAPSFEGDFQLNETLQLESGEVLVNPTLHYAVYGRLNAARDNAVLVCHALSGSALVGAWWPQFLRTALLTGPSPPSQRAVVFSLGKKVSWKVKALLDCAPGR
jgi:homoserine acetyltransferase